MELAIIFFIGPQGSGKGTQAKILAQRLDFFYWEMGGILREVARQETNLGKQVKQMVDNGILLPDELLLEVVETRLAEIPLNQGVIFDGIPRRLSQAEFLINFLKKRGQTNLLTLFIDLPKEESLKRLLLRAQKENRTDDSQEVIELRLKQYYADTLPVLEYSKQQTNYIEIDGTPPIGEVTKEINRVLEIG